MLNRIILIISFFLSINTGVLAQCAMCRSTLESNVSTGEIGIAAGINLGILYLFVMPYLAIGTVAYFWYKNSRKARTVSA